MARRWMFAVAALVVLIGSINFLRNPRESGPGDYWIPISGEATLLRSPTNSSPSQDVTDALRAYRQRDAATAVEELRAFKVPVSDATVYTLRDLYLASALVNAAQPEEALATLETLGIESLPQPWRGHARWTYYLALMRVGRTNEAFALLGSLAQETGEIGQRAREEVNRAGRSSRDRPGE
ncbi:MAG TPA: hypothetical protein VFT13_02270 [Candidatus Krumholzibacteria bacterium]|nr:hypothetical protein [Candidatus Krumholzibacteria bacterium]